MKNKFIACLFLILGISQHSEASNYYIRNYFFTHIDNNKEVAITYLLKNADTIADTAYILGIIYLEAGKLDLAEKFLLKAISKNHKPAINCLGDIYYTDKNDVPTATQYYKKAANLGYGPSQFNLGIIHLKHYNQYKEASYWLNKAKNNKSDLPDEVRQSASKYLKVAEQNIK